MNQLHLITRVLLNLPGARTIRACQNGHGNSVPIPLDFDYSGMGT
jgi:hypothetical protein